MIHTVIRMAIFDVFDNNYEYSPAACSMQHAIFDLFDIPLDVPKKQLFAFQFFGGKVSLIISIIDLRSDLKHLAYKLFDLADNTLDDTIIQF